MKSVRLKTHSLALDADVAELQSHLGAIYQRQNSDFSEEMILGRLMEAIAETASPFDLPGIQPAFVKSLSWLLAFCNKTAISLQETTIKRFPGCCPLCLSEHCVCERTYRLPSSRARHLGRKNPDEWLATRATRILAAPRIARGRSVKQNLNWFSAELAAVYSVNSARWGVNRYYFPAKMLRESGKLANGFRGYKLAAATAVGDAAKARLERDTADFFAWLIGFWTQTLPQGPEADIQTKFVERYQLGCPYCRKLPCACDLAKRLGHKAEIIPLGSTAKTADAVEELEELLAEFRRQIEAFPQIASQYEANLPAKDSQGWLRGTIEALRKLPSFVGQAKEVSGDIDTIVRRAISVAEQINRLLPGG
jgi:hypothetical protein